MLIHRLAAVIASTLLASCSSSPTSRGIVQVQEFNPTTSRWETTNRVVEPTPAQPVTPVVVKKENSEPQPTSAVSNSVVASEEAAAPVQSGHSGGTSQPEGLWKRTFKWLPGVN